MIGATNPIYAFSAYSGMNDRLQYYDSILDEERKFSRELISPDIAYKHQGDFYGLLQKLNVDKKLFLFALHLNGYTTPFEYDGVRTSINIPIEVDFPNQ